MCIEDYYWYTNDYRKRMELCAISEKMDCTPPCEQARLASDATTDELTLVALHQRRYRQVRVEVARNTNTPEKVLYLMTFPHNEECEWVRKLAENTLLKIKQINCNGRSLSNDCLDKVQL